MLGDEVPTESAMYLILNFLHLVCTYILENVLENCRYKLQFIIVAHINFVFKMKLSACFQRNL